MCGPHTRAMGEGGDGMERSHLIDFVLERGWGNGGRGCGSCGLCDAVLLAPLFWPQCRPRLLHAPLLAARCVSVQQPQSPHPLPYCTACVLPPFLQYPPGTCAPPAPICQPPSCLHDCTCTAPVLPHALQYRPGTCPLSASSAPRQGRWVCLQTAPGVLGCGCRWCVCGWCVCGWHGGSG